MVAVIGQVTFILILKKLIDICSVNIISLLQIKHLLHNFSGIDRISYFVKNI